VQGLPVFDLDPDARTIEPELTARIDEALQIIDHFAPARFDRLRRDVRRILLRRMPGLQGKYWPALDAVVLDREFVQRRGNALIALVLVHEATHARLEHAGFRYHPEMRARIERICTRAEIALAERMPGSEVALTRLNRALDRAGPTDQQLVQYHLAEAQAAGSPAWVLHLLRRRYGLPADQE
jgi:hypothetical protein